MEKKHHHKLFWFTIVALVFTSGAAYVVADRQLPPQIEVSIEGQPTIGNEKSGVQVVVFEEPKCPYCKRFTVQVYPKIKENYIDTGKISFTVIPVSFLKGSMPAATALLCVYQQNKGKPDSQLFFTFLDYLYEKQGDERTNWTNPSHIQKLAKEASPSINLAKLKRCMDDEPFRIQIEKNTIYGNRLMGHLITPTVFVNGMKTNDSSYETISELIDVVIEQKETK